MSTTRAFLACTVMTAALTNACGPATPPVDKVKLAAEVHRR
jgi:hypothetical protein